MEEMARRGKKRDRGMTREKEKEKGRGREKQGRRWCSRKAVGGGDGSVEQKGCGEKEGWRGGNGDGGERRCRGVSN